MEQKSYNFHILQVFQLVTTRMNAFFNFLLLDLDSCLEGLSLAAFKVVSKRLCLIVISIVVVIKS